jgi:hypothetical protein
MLLSFSVQSCRVPLAGSRHVHWYQLDQENCAIARRAHEARHESYLCRPRRRKIPLDVAEKTGLNDPWNICWREV